MYAYETGFLSAFYLIRAWSFEKGGCGGHCINVYMLVILGFLFICPSQIPIRGLEGSEERERERERERKREKVHLST